MNWSQRSKRSACVYPCVCVCIYIGHMFGPRAQNNYYMLENFFVTLMDFFPVLLGFGILIKKEVYWICRTTLQNITEVSGFFLCSVCVSFCIVLADSFISLGFSVAQQFLSLLSAELSFLCLKSVNTVKRLLVVLAHCMKWIVYHFPCRNQFEWTLRSVGRIIVEGGVSESLELLDKSYT